MDKLLKGANPADLPVEQASTFELVIDLKDRQGPRLTIPPFAPAAGGPGDRVGGHAMLRSRRRILP